MQPATALVAVRAQRTRLGLRHPFGKLVERWLEHHQKTLALYGGLKKPARRISIADYTGSGKVAGVPYGDHPPDTMPLDGPRVPRHILIYGPPAAGKLTVARALADRHGMVVLDNHATIDPALRLFDFGTPEFAAFRT